MHYFNQNYLKHNGLYSVLEEINYSKMCSRGHGASGMLRAEGAGCNLNRRVRARLIGRWHLNTFFFLTFYFVLGYSFPGGPVVKDPPAKQETQVRFLGREIPQTGAWQATVPGVTRVRNNWATKPPPPPPQLINNTGTVPGGQQRGSAVHMHVSVLPQTPFPSRLPHNIEQRSMCCREVLVGYAF